MRKKRTLSGDLGLYFHTDAAELISDQSGHTEGRRKKLADDMFKAIHEGSLHAYDFHNGNLLTIPISPTSPLCVRPADVNDWLKEKTAYECRWSLGATEGTDKDKSSPHASPSPEPPAKKRQAERWQACLDAGLNMPNDTYSQYPKGFGKVAESFGIKRQSLRDDLNKYRERKFSK
jgi:hypothetical protein